MDVQIVLDTLTKIITDIINFLPKFINGVIILLAGFAIAGLLRWIVSGSLRRLGLDGLVERGGITNSLRGVGVTMPLSRVIGQTLFALLLLSFLISAARLMELEAVASLLEQLLLFLPNIIAAAIIFVLGGLVAQFAGNLVATLAQAGAVQYAARVGRIVRYLLTLFVIILALGQLGVDTAILVTSLTIMIAAFGLALGLGLGLGARGIIQHILAGYYLRQRLPAGQLVELEELRGTVRGVGSVNTALTTADSELIIPNTLLLESVLRSPQTPTPPVS